QLQARRTRWYRRDLRLVGDSFPAFLETDPRRWPAGAECAAGHRPDRALGRRRQWWRRGDQGHQGHSENQRYYSRGEACLIQILSIMRAYLISGATSAPMAAVLFPKR